RLALISLSLVQHHCRRLQGNETKDGVPSGELEQLLMLENEAKPAVVLQSGLNRSITICMVARIVQEASNESLPHTNTFHKSTLPPNRAKLASRLNAEAMGDMAGQVGEPGPKGVTSCLGNVTATREEHSTPPSDYATHRQTMQLITDRIRRREREDTGQETSEALQGLTPSKKPSKSIYYLSDQFSYLSCSSSPPLLSSSSSPPLPVVKRAIMT
ncbi:unnamed protein product, partial [Pleuronectes platessa]